MFLSSLQIGIVNRNRNIQLQLIALLAATFTYSCYLRYLRLLAKYRKLGSFSQPLARDGEPAQAEAGIVPVVWGMAAFFRENARLRSSKTRSRLTVGSGVYTRTQQSTTGV